MEDKSVQEIKDELTKELRESLDNAFAGKPYDEENRKRMREMFKSYFMELHTVSVTAELEIEKGPEEK
jgi:hypothetical protein